MWSRWELVTPRLCTITLVVAAMALFIMTFGTAADVALRFAINAPIPSMKELCMVLQPWVVFLPFMYTLITGTHVRMGILVERASPRLRQRLNTATFAVDLLFFGIISYFSWTFFWHSFAIKEVMWALVLLPQWVGKLSMPLGVWLIAFQCLFYASTRAKTWRETGEVKG